MLVILSDIHLGDGTCGRSISSSAFYLFGDRLRELAYNASWRTDGSYRPVESIEVLLLGDVLDPLHSTLWLEPAADGAQVRPWTDSGLPQYAEKLEAITTGILAHNAAAAGVLRRAAAGDLVHLPPADGRGQPAEDNRERVPVPVRIYYMVGNHDWFYRLPGPAFETIRRKIVQALGLANVPGPLPHDPADSPQIQDLFSRYHLLARHGDLFDSFNYDKSKGRNAATLGDVFAVEMLNRFPIEIRRQLGSEVPDALVENLRELTNVRPALATPLWITSQIREYCMDCAVQDKLKAIWDRMGEEFLAVDFVRQADKWMQFDTVDAFQIIMKISRRAKFTTINEVITWLRQKMWESGEISFVRNALKEPAFLHETAQYIVYGHTHHHEIISLDASGMTPYPTAQLYFNSGTWHTYYDLAVYKPEEQKFIPYQVLTYLCFYTGDERRGRRFETWSGAFA